MFLKKGQKIKVKNKSEIDPSIQINYDGSFIHHGRLFNKEMQKIPIITVNDNCESSNISANGWWWSEWMLNIIPNVMDTE